MASPDNSKVDLGHQIGVDLLPHPFPGGPRHDLFLQIVEHLALLPNHFSEVRQLRRARLPVGKRLGLGT